MYWLFIFLSCSCLWTVQGQDGAFLVTSESNQEALCVLTGEATRSAVDWTTSANNIGREDFVNYRKNEVKYNHSTGSQLDCSFEVRETCGYIWLFLLYGAWNSVGSFQYNFAPRIDAGWNDLKLFYSEEKKYEEIPSENKFYLGIDHYTSVQYISISVKVAHDAHVVFCDGYQFLTSRCYMVILAGFEGYKISTIIKCVKGIPALIADEKGCKEMRVNATHDQILVDDKEWRHFSFSLHQSDTMTELKVYAKVPGETKYKTILEYKDEDGDHIRPTFFGVKSYTTSALWKIHNYKFLVTSSIIEKGVLLEQAFEPRNNYLCLKMAVALCLTCSLQLHVEDRQGRHYDSNIVNGRMSTNPDDLIYWFEARFIISLGDEQQRNLKLKYSTTVDTVTTKPFWGIDNIRECNSGEIKALSFNGKYKKEHCQILDEDIFKLTRNFDIASVTNPTDRPNCEKWFRDGKSCRGIHISSTDGRTHQCYRGYDGKNCEVKTVLTSQYELVQSGYTNMIVKAKNIKVHNGSTAGYMRMQFQYHCNCVDVVQPWKNLTELLPISSYHNQIKIPPIVARRHLITGKDLLIRLILYVDGSKDFSDKTAGTNITPTCVHIGEGEKTLDFKPSENSITISQEIRGSVCPMSFYDIRVEHEGGKRANCTDHDNECIVQGLQPFTSYNLVFKRMNKNIYRKIVKTADAGKYAGGIKNSNLRMVTRYSSDIDSVTSGPIEDLEIYSRESDSLSLRWKPPSSLRGIIQGYKIQVVGDQMGYNISGEPCQLWEGYTCHTTTNLEPGAFYEIQIRAYTRNPRPGEMRKTETIKTEEIAPSEPLELKQKNQNTTEISWKHPWFPNGKIEYFEIDCEFMTTQLRKEPMTKSIEKIKEMKNPMKEYTYKLIGLAPASTYSVTVTAYNQHKGIPSEIEITTPLVAPHVTGELQIHRLPYNQIQITIPLPDYAFVLNKSGFYIIVSETDSKVFIIAKKQKQDEHKQMYGEVWKEAKIDENHETISWIAKKFEYKSNLVHEINETQVIIGINGNSGDNIWDGPLSQESSYKIAVVYYNEINGKQSYSTLFYEESETNYYLWSLLSLLIVAPAIAFAVWKIYALAIKKKSDKTNATPEHLELQHLEVEENVDDHYVDVDAILAANPNASILPVLTRPARKHPDVVQMITQKPIERKIESIRGPLRQDQPEGLYQNARS